MKKMITLYLLLTSMIAWSYSAPVYQVRLECYFAQSNGGAAATEYVKDITLKYGDSLDIPFNFSIKENGNAIINMKGSFKLDYKKLSWPSGKEALEATGELDYYLYVPNKKMIVASISEVTHHSTFAFHNYKIWEEGAGEGYKKAYAKAAGFYMDGKPYMSLCHIGVKE